MAQDTLLIKNPSDKLLGFVRKMRENKESEKKELLSKKDLYFKK